MLVPPIKFIQEIKEWDEHKKKDEEVEVEINAVNHPSTQETHETRATIEDAWTRAIAIVWSELSHSSGKKSPFLKKLEDNPVKVLESCGLPKGYLTTLKVNVTTLKTPRYNYRPDTNGWKSPIQIYLLPDLKLFIPPKPKEEHQQAKALSDYLQLGLPCVVIDNVKDVSEQTAKDDQ